MTKQKTQPAKAASPAKTPPRRTPSRRSAIAMEERERLFVEAYITNDRNGAEAARAAGYGAGSAKRQAVRMLERPGVIKALRERQDALIGKLEITTERVLKEVARVAFFDPRRLFNADGSPKAINDLDEDTAASLAGLDVLEEFDGVGKDRKFVGYTKKYKLASKLEALDKLMKNLGLFEKDNGQKGSAEAAALKEFFQSIYGDRNKLPIAADNAGGQAAAACGGSPGTKC